MKLWTLLENTACRENLTCEHGLSLYLETGKHKILFDMGQTEAFAENAEKMGVSLSQVDFAVLSHGHYDHGGGMRRFLELNSHAPVYVNQFAFAPHYHGAEKYIGLDTSLAEDPRLRLTHQSTEIAPGITLYTACPLTYPLDHGGLTLLEDGILKPEDFRHEQYLLIEEGQTRILLSGCSHRGIRNIAEAFRPDILIGGFHFMNITDEKNLRASADALLRCPTRYYTGHCTGLSQYRVLKERMGSRLEALSTGLVFEI